MRRAGVLLLASALSPAIGGCFDWPNSDSDGGTNAAPGTYTFCQAVTATCSEEYGGPAAAEQYLLGEPASCVEAATDQCATLESAYSAAYRSAVVDCARHYSPCDAAFNDCVGLQTAGTPPTAVQAKVEADFCGTFGLGEDDPSATCADYFKVTALGDDGVPGDEQYSYGLGYVLLTVNDDLATRMDDCIKTSVAPAEGTDGGPGDCDDCLLKLQSCVDTVVDDATRPSGCQPDGGVSLNGG